MEEETPQAFQVYWLSVGNGIHRDGRRLVGRRLQTCVRYGVLGVGPEGAWRWHCNVGTDSLSRDLGSTNVCYTEPTSYSVRDSFLCQHIEYIYEAYIPIYLRT